MFDSKSATPLAGRIATNLTGVLTCNLETGPYFIDIPVLVLCFSNDKIGWVSGKTIAFDQPSHSFPDNSVYTNRILFGWLSAKRAFFEDYRPPHIEIAACSLETA